MFKTNRRSKFVSIISVLVILAVCLGAALPVAGAQTTPTQSLSSSGKNMITKTIPISFEMEAGAAWYDQFEPNQTPPPKLVRTVHSGEGSIQPFGPARYWAGIGYSIADNYPQPSYMNDAWKSQITSTGLFCIYRLDDGRGEFYAYDGIVKGLQSVANDDGKMDYLINVIVGGTGIFEGATGVLLGATPGRGPITPEGELGAGLPTNILKIMSGYVNINIKKSKVNTDQYPALDLKNPQVNPDALTQLADGKLIPINMEMEAGAAQYNEWTSGTTTDSGIGWVEPFGRADFWAVTGSTEATSYTPAYMNSDFVKTYNTGDSTASAFCIYKVRNSDNTADTGYIYAYEGVVGNLAQFGRNDGGMDYVVDWIVGGTGAFEGATGVMLGDTIGRGYDAATGLPVSLLKCMSGYVLVK